MRRPHPALTLAWVLAVLVVVAPAAAAGPPAPVPLSSGWELSFDQSSWRPTTVPGVFDGNTPASEFGGRVGWYRVMFTGPRAPSGYSWDLRFESVRRVADATLNGVPIGRNTDPYVPFELPATGLKPGQPNVLEVRVDNRKGHDPREGWWNWGGIIRPVTLVPRGRVELQNPGVMTERISGDSATMLFDGWVTNRSAQTLAPSVGVGVGSTHVTHSAGSLAPGQTRRVRFSFTVPHPRLWAPGHPALYPETIETRVGGRVEQRDTGHVGIRTVRVVDGTLELNGRPVSLRGASIMEDVKGHGPALTNADMDAIVARLKALHADVTRSHFLLNERLLDRLDRAGIMVWSQAPIYHRDRLLETPQQRAVALATVRGTVLNARIHPSVFTHSVANELSVVPDTVPGTRDFVNAARRLVGDLDPTLPPSIDTLSYPGYGKENTYAKFPLLGVNSYFGWYPGKVDHPVGNLADLRPYLEHMHRMYPTTALIVTEFGAEATEKGPADKKQTYAFQSDYVKKNLQIVDSLPFVQGAIYWTLQEFAVKPFWDGGANIAAIRTDSIHNKGLIAYGGYVKPAWHVAEHEFAATPLYRPVANPQARPADPFGWFLLGFVPLAIGSMLLLMGWALRDIWRLTRPPEAQVLPLPRRKAA
jgi:beta-galactosidase/beta-glucuronidase